MGSNFIVYGVGLPEKKFKPGKGYTYDSYEVKWEGDPKNMPMITNIPKEFLKKLRENYKKILGETDYMNEDHALKKFDEALIKTLLED